MNRCLVCGSPAVVSPRYNGTVTVLQDWHCLTCRASGVITYQSTTCGASRLRWVKR